jgi:hypothetical protein
VILGDVPKISIGSHNISSSQIDQREERQAEKTASGGGFAAGREARIYTVISVEIVHLSSLHVIEGYVSPRVGMFQRIAIRPRCEEYVLGAPNPRNLAQVSIRGWVEAFTFPIMDKEIYTSLDQWLTSLICFDMQIPTWGFRARDKVVQGWIQAPRITKGKDGGRG